MAKLQSKFNEFALLMENYVNKKLILGYQVRMEGNRNMNRRRNMNGRRVVICHKLAISYLLRKRRSRETRETRKTKADIVVVKRAARIMIDDMTGIYNAMNTKGIKHVKVTQLHQVRAVFLLREEFKTDFTCLLVHGSSPRAPMYAAIREAARDMLVTLIDKGEYENMVRERDREREESVQGGAVEEQRTEESDEEEEIGENLI